MRIEIIVFLIGLFLVLYYKTGRSVNLNNVNLPSKKWVIALLVISVIGWLSWWGWNKYQSQSFNYSKEKALAAPDQVLWFDLKNDSGLDSPIPVKKGEVFNAQTVPESIPSLLIKYSETKEGLKDADWVREGGSVDLGIIGKKDMFLDFKLPRETTISTKLKVSIKKR